MPEGGKTHVRFNEDEVALARSRRGSLLCNTFLMKSIAMLGAAVLAFSAHALTEKTWNDGAGNKDLGNAVNLGGTLAHGSELLNLRFYGSVSSESLLLENGTRDLVITAESDEKAKLLQAKFLSDLMLDGVSARREGDRYEVPGGWMAGVREGRKVHLLHAKERTALDAVLGKSVKGITAAEMKVPMAVDALEKWPFRFYWRLGETPKDDRFHDITEELDFCRTNGLGLVFWTGPHWADTAANVLSDGQWGHLLDRCRRDGIPVCLNFNSTEFPTRNFYPEDMNSRQPGFVGGFVRFGGSHYGGAGHLSVDHPKANAHIYESVSNVMQRYDTENVISLHEVNGELKHGDHNIFLNYGPEVDRSFREFLKKRYSSPEAYGVKSWDEVRFPEIAEFAGYGPNAIDLAGSWRLKYTGDPSEADFAVEEPSDTNWVTTAKIPGDDQQLFLKTGPAVLRRRFDYHGTGRTWLYLWDLNNSYKESIEVYLNGQLAKSEKCLFNFYHWMYVEVTNLLKDGENTVALRLPKGLIGYKIYLTHDEPKFFPYASERMNRLWIDTVDWNTERRVATITESMNAMRSVDPDKSAVLMAPSYYSRQLREIARLRGGRFHDTGGMAACFHEQLPMLMRGANLPFTLEPGGPAQDVTGLRRMLGIYMAEAVNAFHYFIHVGNITWDPALKADFLRMLPALKMMGKVRLDQGDVAMVIDSDIDKYLGYPWCNTDFNIAFPSGYWPWRFNTTLAKFPMDAIIPDDFENGLADRYKLLIDCNNTIIKQTGAEAIRRWVEKGGVYLAMFQTGRHAVEGADKWTMSDLTGFRGEVFARYTSDGGIDPNSQDVFMKTPAADDYMMIFEKKQGTGTKLEPVVPEAVTLATWRDHGGTAIGYRPLGKGAVYTFGVQLSAHAKGHGVWFSEMLDSLFTRLGVSHRDFDFGNGLNKRHFVSNNGLYDVWYAWNGDWKETRAYELTFEDGRQRELTDVLTGKPFELTGTIPPNQFVMAVSPRFETDDAAARWFYRQCGDKQGTMKESFDPPHDGFGENTLDLSYDWTVNGMPHVKLGLWEKGVTPGVVSNFNVAVRHFCVPSAWTNGTVYLSHTGMYDSTVIRLEDRKVPNAGLRFYLNGQPLDEKPSQSGFSMMPLENVKAGDECELRLEISVDGFVRFTGTQGATFLTYVPAPERIYPLGREWEIFSEPFGTNAIPLVLPGRTYEGGCFIRRSLDLSDLKPANGEHVILHMDGAPSVVGVKVNGQYIRRHHHGFGGVINLDITDFLKDGENEFVIVTRGWKVLLPVPELRFVVKNCRK